MALSGTKLGKELEAARMANKAATSAAVDAHVERRKLINALRGVVGCLADLLFGEVPEVLCVRELKVAQDLLTRIDGK